MQSLLIIKRHQLLTICLLSPVGVGVLRKIAPGQPAYIEVLAIGPVLLAAFWALHHRRSLSHRIAHPLLAWAFVQAMFALLTVRLDWRIGVAGVVMRIAPMLMTYVAFVTIRSQEDFQKVLSSVCKLAPILLPVGIIGSLFGNDVLPFFLKPIDKLMLSEKYYRIGYQVVSTIFTTQWVMSWSMFAILFLALISLNLTDRKSGSLWWWLVVISALTLIYLSTRRGAFIAGLLGITLFLLQKRGQGRIKTIMAALTVLCVIIELDRHSSPVMNAYGQRSFSFLSDLNITDRFNKVFLDLFLLWLRLTPFGTGLGVTGPEGKAFGNVLGGLNFVAVEVGGAQLMAEMGIFGAFIMPLMLVLLLWNLRIRARGLICCKAVNMLLFHNLILFVFYYTKGLLILSNLHVALFLFWAVPGICEALIQSELAENRRGHTDSVPSPAETSLGIPDRFRPGVGAMLSRPVQAKTDLPLPSNECGFVYSKRSDSHVSE